MVQDVLAELKSLPVAALSDAQGSFGVMDPAIRAMVPGVRAVGPAYTVKCYPGSIITVHRGLYEIPPGHVLVVDGEGDVRGALFGEIMAREAVAKQVAGVVIDGAVRDVGGIRALGLPVFARTANPRVGTNRRVGLTGVPVSCGGVVVSPGDYVVADDEGIIVVPAGEVLRTIDLARGVLKKEAAIRAAMGDGQKLLKILGFYELVYPQGEGSREEEERDASRR